MGKWAELNVGKKKGSVPTKNNLVQASKILSTIFFLLRITHLLVSTVLEIFSAKKWK
jgi:hypothetical protein